jgi:hypothetical protein
MRSKFDCYAYSCACGLLLAVSFSAPALAQNADASAGTSAVLGISGEATGFEFDVVNSYASAIDDSTFLFIRQPTDGADFDEWGGGGNLHFLMPFTDPMFGFDGFQLTVGGSFASGDESATQTLVAGIGDEFYDVLPISGAVSPGAIADSNDPDPNVNLSNAVDFMRIFGMPALRGSFGDGAISLNMGPLVEMKKLEVDIEQSVATTTRLNNLSEEVDVWSAGPTAAISVRMPLGNSFEWFASGRGAVLWANGQLDASQTYDIGGGPVAVSADDESSDFAALLKISTGIGLNAGAFSAEVYGAAEWRNDMYTIVNPISGAGIDADATTFDAAHVEQTDMTAFSVGIRGSVRLGGV